MEPTLQAVDHRQGELRQILGAGRILVPPVAALLEQELGQAVGLEAGRVLHHEESPGGRVLPELGPEGAGRGALALDLHPGAPELLGHGPGDFAVGRLGVGELAGSEHLPVHGLRLGAHLWESGAALFAQEEVPAGLEHLLAAQLLGGVSSQGGELQMVVRHGVPVSSRVDPSVFVPSPRSLTFQVAVQALQGLSPPVLDPGETTPFDGAHQPPLHLPGPVAAELDLEHRLVQHRVRLVRAHAVA